jgi:hypothetical protein
MDFRTNKQTKAQAKTPKTATPRSDWTIKSVGLAVGIAAAVAVIFAILKPEPPSGSGDSDSIKTDSEATGNKTAHWQPEEQSKAFAQYADSKSYRVEGNADGKEHAGDFHERQRRPGLHARPKQRAIAPGQVVPV